VATKLTNQDQELALLTELMQRVASAPAIQPMAHGQAAHANQSAVEQHVEPAEAPRQRIRTVKRNSIGEALAYLAAAALAAGLWVVDGYYTLVALAALGLPIVAVVDWPWLLAPTALLAWGIPFGVEVIEQVFLGRRGWPLLVFAGVAGLNALATGYGLWTDLAGRTAWLAAESIGLWSIAVLGGLVLAFGPGRLLVRALTALIDLAR
jgi:hypothetical protein